MSKNDEHFLNVAYVTDGKYLPHVAASLVSLSQNAGLDVQNVYVAVEKTSRPAIAKLRRLGKKLFKRRFHLVSADTIPLPAMRTHGHITSTTYKRFLLDKIVQPTDEHVLYLDGDTLVSSRLTGLRRFIERMSSSRGDVGPSLWASSQLSEIRLRKSGLFQGDYFNAGVMLIDLEKWRQRAPLEDLVKISLDYEELFEWHDQDALNVVFQGRWDEIGEQYNSTDNSGPEEPKTAIKHFAGSDKPWYWGTQHPWSATYKGFRRKSGFWPFLPTVLWFRVRRRLIRKLIDPIYLRIRRQ